ncbi:MAG: hypothetical protein GY853_05860 [PVC group bacterium]|nr:hypothetical protein [PVC group bacterium]
MNDIGKEQLRKYRKEKFNVKVDSKDIRWKDFEDEKTLSVTHNGYQWISMSLSKHEARKVVDELTKHFKI